MKNKKRGCQNHRQSRFLFFGFEAHLIVLSPEFSFINWPQNSISFETGTDQWPQEVTVSFLNNKNILGFFIAVSSLSALAADNLKTGIYRSRLENDFLFSTVAAEGANAGYTDEGLQFHLFAQSDQSKLPLYRCAIKKSSRHFLSQDPSCEGQTTEGLLGYTSAVQSNGLVTLNRYYNPKTLAHVSVIDGSGEKLDGFQKEGLQGYVMAPPPIVPPPSTDDGKKYFGFYAGAMDGVGTENYIPELAQHGNMIHILSSEHMEEKLIECEKLGVKAMVSLDWAFLDEKFRLRSTYVEDFATKALPILKRHQSTIAAFYGLDEPYTNGMSRGLTATEVYTNQETLGRHLKSFFPNIPIAVIFATAEIRDNRPLFPSFDWFAFDCYDSRMKCEGKSVDWYFKTLDAAMKTATAKDRKPRYLMAVPQAGHPAKYGDEGGKQDVLVQAPEYKKIVAQYPNVKAVVPFLWQTFGEGRGKWIGAREMPEVVNYYDSFYRDFVSGNK